MLNDKVKAKGVVHFVLTDEHGNVKEQHEQNLVVNTGLAYIASRMFGTAKSVMSHMAVGTDTTAAAAADSALQTESARVALTSSTIVTTNATYDAIQYVATFNPGTATAALTEAGVFNASSSGDLLCRTVFPVINKGALDTLTITWKVTVA
jgi:hypothetical protein